MLQHKEQQDIQTNQALDNLLLQPPLYHPLMYSANHHLQTTQIQQQVVDQPSLATPNHLFIDKRYPTNHLTDDHTCQKMADLLPQNTKDLATLHRTTKVQHPLTLPHLQENHLHSSPGSRVSVLVAATTQQMSSSTLIIQHTE